MIKPRICEKLYKTFAKALCLNAGVSNNYYRFF